MFSSVAYLCATTRWMQQISKPLVKPVTVGRLYQLAVRDYAAESSMESNVLEGAGSWTGSYP